MKNPILIFLVLCAASSVQFSQIILDENLDDWQNAPTIYEDPQHPGDQLNVDFRQLSVSNDQNNLFMLLELGDEVILQESNNIIVFIDTDNNPGSGRSYHGIGAEIEFTFGQREGKFYQGTSTYSINQFDIGLKSSPTVSSAKFEIALDLNAQYNSIEIFSAETIKIVFAQDAADSDRMPDESGGMEYTFTDDILYELDYRLSKSSQSDLRIMSYNIRRDDIFEPGLSGNYERILNAVTPDIIGFQEIYSHTAAETAALVESILPSESGEQWYHAKAEPDIIVVSRYPINAVHQIDGNGAFLLDLRPEFDSDLLLLNAHPPCCQNVAARTREIDHMMSFVRDAKENGGELTIDEHTPIVILGDMNLVSSSETQQILTTGDLVNNNLYGPDFTPDWDETDFDDAMPLTTGVPMTFTWYSEWESFSPGRLDYIVYSGSVMELKNSFVLFTKGMDADSLSKYGLQERDVIDASDHLPVVADFSLNTPTDVSDNNGILPENFVLHQNYPNPFNPTTTINYSIPTVKPALPTGRRMASFADVQNSEFSQSAGFALLRRAKGDWPASAADGLYRVTLIVYDILGREAVTLVNERQRPGNYKVTFNAASLTSGVYFYRLTSGDMSLTRKMILMR